MEKPILENELEAKITGVSTIENNIEEAKEYALQLKEYYSTLVFNSEQLDIAKSERASINKITKKIADYRKNIIAEFKKPIELFETTAKETEKILKETADYVDLQVKSFESKEKEIKKEECLKLYEEKIEDLKEYLPFEKIFNERWLNKSMSLKAVSDEIEIKKMNVSKGIETIKSLNSKYQVEIMNRYLNTFDVNEAIQLNNQLIEKENIYKKEESKEEIKIEPIKEEINNQNEELMNYTLKLTGTKTQLMNLRKYMELNNIKFEKVG